jgi:hypothetical protein
MTPVGMKEAAEALGVAQVTLRKYKREDPNFPPARWTVSGKEAWPLSVIRRYWINRHK